MLNQPIFQPGEKQYLNSFKVSPPSSHSGSPPGVSIVSWSEGSGALVSPGPPEPLGAFPALGLACAKLGHLSLPPL